MGQEKMRDKEASAHRFLQILKNTYKSCKGFTDKYYFPFILKEHNFFHVALFFHDYLESDEMSDELPSAVCSYLSPC